MLDLTPPISTIATRPVFLVPAAALIAWLKSPRTKGFFGEKMVEMAARVALDPKKYIQLHNLILRDTDGSTTQIDHIVLSPYGIFVIEDKNYRGWIFGGEKDAKWTQKLGKKSNTFQNPLRQNYRHIKVLSKLLGVEEETFKSVIVFSGEFTFKTPMPPNVVMGLGYIDYIRSFDTRVMSDQEVRLLEKRLKLASVQSAAAEKEHLASLESCHETWRCPKCGGRMVERRNRTTGARFLGCENFPKCRATVSLQSKNLDKKTLVSYVFSDNRRSCGRLCRNH